MSRHERVARVGTGAAASMGRDLQDVVHEAVPAVPQRPCHGSNLVSCALTYCSVSDAARRSPVLRAKCAPRSREAFLELFLICVYVTI